MVRLMIKARIVTKAAHRDRVAVLCLHPPDETRRRIGSRVDRVKRGHEVHQQWSI